MRVGYLNVHAAEPPLFFTTDHMPPTLCEKTNLPSFYIFVIYKQCLMFLIIGQNNRLSAKFIPKYRYRPPKFHIGRALIHSFITE